MIRLFAHLMEHLSRTPESVVHPSLDELIRMYGDFAYIGSRQTLRQLVLQQAAVIRQRVQQATEAELQAARQINKRFEQRIQRCQQATDEQIAVVWFGRPGWACNSGLFPDFVLALDGANTFGNGSILELKDSEGGSIASFKSTIPTRFKSLDELPRITGSRMVLEACRLRDFPHSLAPDYFAQRRPCFYLVRTHRRSLNEVRLSLVEGSFFETLPKDELLRQVWRQILTESSMPQEQQEQVLPLLARLEQTAIAQSRHVESASVKPRFRIMAEVERDANLHAYPKILPCTVNLVFKREAHHDWGWLRQEFAKEGYSLELQPEGESAILFVVEKNLQLRCFSIWHRRNGEHWCLQWRWKDMQRRRGLR